MITHPELLLAPERCNKMSWDNKGLFPVLRGRFFRVWEGQASLFHGQAGDPPPRCSLSKALEEGWNESIPEHLIHWAEGVPNVGGDPLHECQLLLEWLLQYCVSRLRVLAGNPQQCFHQIHPHLHLL